MSERFTIRVYGLLVEAGRVLVSDEVIRGREITKFPGGGLEFGEGPHDTLIREIKEELGVEAVDVEHFYTTHFFQQSTFHDTPMQVISLYYTFRVADAGKLDAAMHGLRHDEGERSDELFRWLSLETARVEDLSLPIDRHVMGLLLAGR